ncbi:hypothetical protein CN481_22070 [Bacillus sp. AFS006103]|nr:hypothetical protein CN481_22070 [Bacillus sp. AFS006103]
MNIKMIKVIRPEAPEQSLRLKGEVKRLEKYIEYVSGELNEIDSNEIIKSFSKFKVGNLYNLDKNWYSVLLEIFNHKCAYCESNSYLKIPEIDRFRPVNVIDKNEVNGFQYVWLAYEWTNLYPICKECNNYKSGHFPVIGQRIKYGENFRNEEALLVDPCLDSPEEHLFFSDDGKVYPKSKKGNYTVQILNLNRNSLIIERKNNYRQCRDLQFKELMLVQHRAVARQYCADYLSNLNTAGIKGLFEDDENYSVILNLFNIGLNVSKSKSIRMLKSLLKNYNADGLSLEIIDEYRRESIECINIKNIRGLSFKYNFPNQSRTPWLMIVGENGSGKTSILQSITLALVGEDPRLRLGSQRFTNNELSGFVEITFKEMKHKNKTIFFKNNRESQISMRNIAVAAYGSIRITSKNNKIENYEEQIHNIKNLFPTSNYSHFLVNPTIWLDTEEKIQTVSEAILEVLPNDLDKNFTLVFDKKKKSFYISFENDALMEFHQLSSGYQSIIILVMDIMRSICNVRSNQGRYSKGIVLIDEIDAHLHPTWKIKIVESLRKLFPNIQFITTTHDPLCLRGLEPDEIIVLKYSKEKKVEVITELPYQGDLRVDQLLTSDLFGLTSTLDPNMENMIVDKYKKLNDNDLEFKNKKGSSFDYYSYSERERLTFEIIDEALKKRRSVRLDEIDEQTKKKVLSLWGLDD